MREMGGLRKAMPWTFATFLIASLSLAGIWPFSGFWSKDDIVVSAFAGNSILFYLSMITVFMTAFYIFRVIFLTFGGEYRGGAPSEHGGHEPHGPHESSKVMVIPMVFLAAMSILSGWFNITGGFNEFMGHAGHGHEVHSFAEGFFGMLTHPVALLSLLLAVLGILLAYAMYSAKWVSAEAVGRVFKPFYTLFSRKYWMDELYERVIVVRVLVDGVFAGLGFFDDRVVDGMVNGVADGTAAAGRSIRRVQTGQLQVYAMAIAVGVVAIAVCYYLFG